MDWCILLPSWMLSGSMHIYRCNFISDRQAPQFKTINNSERQCMKHDSSRPPGCMPPGRCMLVVAVLQTFATAAQEISSGRFIGRACTAVCGLRGSSGSTPDLYLCSVQCSSGLVASSLVPIIHCLSNLRGTCRLLYHHPQHSCVLVWQYGMSRAADRREFWGPRQGDARRRKRGWARLDYRWYFLIEPTEHCYGG